MNVAAPAPVADVAPLVGATLGGRRIVVTRPQHQALALSELIRAAGGIPVWFPAIEIEALADYSALDAALGRLAAFDLVIFISANAVLSAWPRLSGVWPAKLMAAATGPGTAAALAERGVARIVVPPDQFDSEGLVAELERAGISPKNVLIVKGEGGRDWLAEALRARGAAVEAVAAYRRVAGRADPRIIGELAQANQLGGVVVSSSEGADHLLNMLGARALDWLNRAPVFAPHPRIAAHLRERGLARVVLTAGGDAGLIAGISAHFAGASA
ncbi:MAG: hemD [Betaproteobacteria bacterium]|nr:hemD [Betaproteobacteria bacterium]